MATQANTPGLIGSMIFGQPIWMMTSRTPAQSHKVYTISGNAIIVTGKNLANHRTLKIIGRAIIQR